MSEGLRLKNSLLRAAVRQVKNQLTLRTRVDYLKAVNAALKAALQGEMDEILASLKTSTDPLRNCAAAAIDLAFRSPLPRSAVIPASETLMLKMLDAAEQAGTLTMDSATLARAVHAWADLVFSRFDITGQMLRNAAVNVQRMAQDPVAVEKMKRAARAFPVIRGAEVYHLDGGRP